MGKVTNEIGTKLRFKEASVKYSFIRQLILVCVGLSAIGIATATDLTPDQVKARLAAAGYTNVQIIRREGTQFDARAVQGGKQVMLSVDGKTGAITPQEPKDAKQEHK
jgi:hypothetical protein